MYASEVEKKFHLDLSKLSNDGKAEKRFDFVFVGALGTVFACECNFYSGGGSKPNETARSYKALTEESKDISGFQFVWFTDGTGWNSAKHNLEETFDVLDNLYNLKDAGSIIFDLEKQKVNAGGSGVACLPLVTYSYVFDKMRKGDYERVLIVATGALLNTNLVNQRLTIPAVAHAVSLEVIE